MKFKITIEKDEDGRYVAGWVVNHIEGSHYIMVKEGSDVHLS